MAISVAIVDDDVSILDAVQIALQCEGWQVRTYTTGEALLQDLTDYQPDCLVLDAHMPGMSGADIARWIALHNIGIPILGLTAKPYSEVVAAMTEAGARAILTKPVSVGALVDHVQAAIGHK